MTDSNHPAKLESSVPAFSPTALRPLISRGIARLEESFLPRKLWFAECEHPRGPRSTADGVLIVRSFDTVYAIDSDTGEELWSWQVGETRSELLDAVNGVFYVGHFHAREFCSLEASTGEELWRFTLDDAPRHHPVAIEKSVYVTDWAGVGYALDADTGVERWRYYSGDDDVQFFPASIDNFVFAWTSKGAIISLDADRGGERWRVEFGFRISSSEHHQIVGDSIYVLHRAPGRVYVLDAATGRERWQFPARLWHYFSPAVADGISYIAHDNTLFALDALTGEQLWHIDMEEKMSVKGVSASIVMLSYSSRSAIAVSPHSGAELWRFDGEVCWPPVNGVVYGKKLKQGEIGIEDFENNLWLFLRETIVKRDNSFDQLLNSVRPIGFQAGRIIFAAETESTRDLFNQLKTKEVVEEVLAENLVPALGPFSVSCVIRGERPAVPLDSIYTLYALDESTGRERWHLDTAHPVTSFPISFNGLVMFGSGDRLEDKLSVFALDEASGLERWRLSAGSFGHSWISDFAIVDGRLLIDGEHGLSAYSFDSAVIRHKQTNAS